MQNRECFLKLWDICSIACAFEVVKEEAVHLMWLTEMYLEASDVVTRTTAVHIPSKARLAV